jgi:hypothetical protein
MTTVPAALHPPLVQVRRLVVVYVALTVATLAALVVLSGVGSRAATSEAWGHAVVVAGFAVLLPLRVRAASRGSRRALGAVGVIATVLVVVNLVEALVPGLFPVWMRAEMVGVALLMAAVSLLTLPRRR